MGPGVVSCVCQLFLVYRTRSLLSLSLHNLQPPSSKLQIKAQSIPNPKTNPPLTLPIAQGRNIHKLVAHMCQVKVIKRLVQTENYPKISNIQKKKPNTKAPIQINYAKRQSQIGMYQISRFAVIRQNFFSLIKHALSPSVNIRFPLANKG